MILQILWLFYLSINLSECTGVPKQIHMLFRHGERSPTSTYPTDPYKNFKWPGGLGQLTNRGKLQMYNLGQNLRHYYKNFLPLYYWPTEANFTSSYSERCLMSAELVGVGVFPPKNEQIWNSELLWQPIPVHYLPRNMDNLIAMKTNCSEYDRQFSEVRNSSKVRKLNEENQNLYDFLMDRTGMHVDNIETVESLFNTLEIEQLNNLTLPKWVNNTVLSQMKALAAQNLALYSETEYMKRMKGGFFLKVILNLMRNAISGVQIPSVNMYSGHDLTIVHILRALNLVDTIKPDFGASLIFELTTQLDIKVYYLENWNGHPQEQILVSCENPCTVEKFEESFKPVLPENWEQECKEQTQN